MFVHPTLILIVYSTQFRCVSSVNHHNHTENLNQLIVIFIDGLKFDYYPYLIYTSYLGEFFRRGAHARLLAVFPAEPLPNMYSVVTGLTPSEHGIIGNEMLDKRSNKIFNGTISEDWWFANKQIKTIWFEHEKTEERTSACVGLPICCITHEGFKKVRGCEPQNPETEIRKLMKHVFDHAMDEKQLIVMHWKQLAVTARVGTSGMVDYELTDEAIILTDYVNLKGFRTLGGGSSIQIVKNSKHPNYELLEGLITIPNVHLYRMKDLQKRFPSPVSESRLPEVWIVAKSGWRIYATESALKKDLKVADYGYRPGVKEMYSLLMAFGPDIQPNKTTAGTFKMTEAHHLIRKLANMKMDEKHREIYRMVKNK